VTVYFAYGSNMRSERLRERVGNVELVGPIHVSDWQLAFNKPGRDGTGKANLVPQPGALTWGVGWRLDDEQWPLLDRYEPDYRRTEFRLESRSGDSKVAVAYVFEGPADSAPISPSSEYVEHLIEGAREHGLPDDYRDWLRAQALK
jgi:hypothetical protein